MLKNRHQDLWVEAGCDEAGRGCLAGAVFAAAVILPPDYFHPLLNDSKQLTEYQRNMLRIEIEREAVAWAVASLSSSEIDRLNILKSSIAAMHRALAKLSHSPEFILVDGNRFTAFQNIPHLCVVKGDSKYASIAAASVLAKTYRDEAMKQLHLEYPQYHWADNKGYPTEVHRQAIRDFGVTPHHRRSFRLLPDGEQLSLF